MAVIAYLVRSLRNVAETRGTKMMLVGVMLVLLAGFTFTPFGADPSGRYFVPLAIPLTLFAADMVLRLHERIGFWSWGLVALILAFHLWGTAQCVRRYPPGITTQFYKPSQVDHRYMSDLIEFLEQQGEMRGYTNYWVSYPMAFLSAENLIYVPKLPYHLDFRYTERDNRYSYYGELVAGADRVAYITTNHPALDQYLREQFSTLSVTWQEQEIGDYHVFYNLSQVVRPLDIGLGVTTP
jgi:hypothetical protein